MNGPEAKAAFERASKLVKAGEYEDALSVEMLPSDRRLIEARIFAAAKQAASANTTKERT